VTAIVQQPNDFSTSISESRLLSFELATSDLITPLAGSRTSWPRYAILGDPSQLGFASFGERIVCDRPQSTPAPFTSSSALSEVWSTIGRRRGREMAVITSSLGRHDAVRGSTRPVVLVRGSSR